MIRLSILALCLSSIDCFPTLWKHKPRLDDIPKDPVEVYPLFKKEAMVRLDYGAFVGRDRRKTRQYFGIPYAAPPIDDLRFEHPQPPKKFYGVKEVFRHGNGCFQDPMSVPLFGLALNRSEDCLNLSIWAPEGHSEEDEPIPVMVWILPGGFTSGYVSNPLYSKAFYLTIDGGNIVRNSKEKVMVVSFNYRMGFFGWTASREFQDAGLLNMGIYDIIAAFEWVKKYIHKFGGDPNRVTAFGESAGGSMCFIF
jgi:para-nitrobenzyl esterase